jgi:hypothetical protein
MRNTVLYTHIPLQSHLLREYQFFSYFNYLKNKQKMKQNEMGGPLRTKPTKSKKKKKSKLTVSVFCLLAGISLPSLKRTNDF